MPDLHPMRYFGATLNTLETASENEFDCTQFSQHERATLEEAAAIIEELQDEYVDN